MKLKFYNENILRKVIAIALTPVVLGSCATFTSCSKQEDTKIAMSQDYIDYDSIINSVKENVKTIFPGMNEELVQNYTLVLLLELIAKEDVNGKVSSDIINRYKSVINVNVMMNDFNSVLNILENTMIQENSIISMSATLPSEKLEDKNILYCVESITSNIIKLVNNNGNSEEIKKEFNKLYKLFVEEDELELNGYNFKIRDLDYSIRALASSYARTATYFARNYITEKEYSAMDERTNHQNSKPYIKEKLEILSNGVVEKSEINVIETFDNKYKEVQSGMNGYITIEAKNIKLLIDCLNMEYLSSDKVSTGDKNIVLGEYSDKNVSDLLISIDALFVYSLNQYQNNLQTNNIFDYSKLLVNEYVASEKGSIDKKALSYVLAESLNLLNSINKDTSYNDIMNNIHFKNLSLYITKQDFNYATLDSNGNVLEETKVNWQSISDGTNFVCHEIIRYTLEYIKNMVKFSSYEEGVYNTYLTKSNSNLEESIQAYQNAILGECEKVDIKEYIKK